MSKLLLSLLLLAAIAVGTTAFLAPKLHSSASALRKPQSNHFGRTNAAFSFASSSTYLSSSSSPGSDSNSGNAFPKARTDIRNFLTQRSIQSFVYLLNQCREEHTVQWLEKKLDFTSIDNFHGTGAFNQTKFPEWDSIFLDCIDSPEEVIVIQIRQRRRQRKLSGHNAYFESLKSSASTAKRKAKEGTKPRTTNPAFSTAMNYLDAMKPATIPSSTANKHQTSKTTGRRLSGSSNYLDNLSSSPASSSSQTKKSIPIKKNDSKKTNEKESSLEYYGEKKNPTGVCNTDKSEEEVNEKSSEKPQKKPTQCRIFAPGKNTSYLESLSTIFTAASSRDDSKDTTEERSKTKQSTEISKNPFLDEKAQEYELSIDPPALVRRILSVREQLSKEWVEDLDMLIQLNDEITESFEEYNNKAATKESEESDDDEDNNLKIVERDAADEENGGKDDDESSSDLDALLKILVGPVDIDFDPDKTSFVSSNASLETDTEKACLDEKKCQTVFDRSILNTWSQSLWSPKRSSSPYRKASFDLLLLLATQESIHRVLNCYKKDNTIRPETHEWLFNFYADNVHDYFDGHQRYARSEDFLEEMVKSPRTLIETNDAILAWVDPASVAEDIVRERSEVTLDWMRVAETILDEHTDLRRLLFTYMVSKSFPDESMSDTILAAVKNEAEEDSTSSPTEAFGVFE